MRRFHILIASLAVVVPATCPAVAEERDGGEPKLHTVQINSLEDLKAYFEKKLEF